MFLKELLMVNFRNFNREELRLWPGLVLVRGKNGQGKSNLLEAIYNVCTASSFRTTREADMVRWNSPYYYLQGKLYFQKKLYKLEVGYENKKNRKVVKVNGRKDKIKDFCPVVFFIPEDLELIRRGPQVRRSFLDRELCQISTSYESYLRRYNKALKQKNKLLKMNRNAAHLDSLIRSWNEQMVYFGSRIISYRLQQVQAWSRLAAENFSYLFQSKNYLSISYQSSVPLKTSVIGESLPVEIIEESLEGMIEDKKEEEKKRCVSLVGPHRDDMVFLMEGREARRFASHGQQRSAIIALKAAQLQYYGDNKEKPLFILDDVLSELDYGKRQRCISLFDKAEQVFITAADEGKSEELEPYMKNFERSFSLWIEQGSVVKIEEYGKTGKITGEVSATGGI